MAEMGRLAFREEGVYWHAYYALPNTMEGALPLATIHMRFVNNKKRRREFMELMKHCVSEIIRERTGQNPHWPTERPAPEHERTKNAS